MLPFANVGGDPELSYLVDGLTEDIITDLSRFRQLRVIARDSCFRHRDAGTDLRAAAQTLGADYVVTGSVRRQGSRLRLSAQLTAADSRNELWAERFDRSTEDVFAATDELVRTIVGTLAGRVRAALAKRKPPANFAAYDCVLRAHAALTKIGDLGEEAEARRLFEQALACDPHIRAPMPVSPSCCCAIGTAATTTRRSTGRSATRSRRSGSTATTTNARRRWAGFCCTGARSI